MTPAESPLPVPEQASTVTGDPPTIAALQTQIEHLVTQNALLASERAALLARVAEQTIMLDGLWNSIKDIEVSNVDA